MWGPGGQSQREFLGVVYSQGYGLSSSHVQMRELDYKEGWVPKKWCFRTAVLQMTLESPLESKEIQPVNPKGNQPWILWKDWCWSWNSSTLQTADSLEKTLMLGKIEGRRRRGWQRMRWLDGITDLPKFTSHELGQTLGDGEGQGSLACWSPWCLKESDTTRLLNKNSWWIWFVFGKVFWRENGGIIFTFLRP